MIKFFTRLNTIIANDKLLHFFWSSTTLVFLSFFLSILNASIVLVGMALAKELVWDLLLKKGNCSFLDFIFGILPIAVYYSINIL